MPPRQPAASNPSARGADEARERLLRAALTLFAHQGYGQTTTRELAEAAQVNVAAISYYFGDKAGLYRAVFMQPLGDDEADDTAFSRPGLSLAQALHGFFAGFVVPLQQEADTARLCMKLHYREMLEPTGMWEEQIARSIRPMHDALLVVLCRHLALDQPDQELQALALGLAGLGVHLHVGHEVNDVLAPAVGQGPQPYVAWHRRLLRWGLALVQDEALRRGLPVPPAGDPP